MKKIIISIFLVLFASSLSFSALPGKFGGELSNLIIGDPINIVICGKGMFFYQFTEDFSAGIGIIDINDTKVGISGSNDSHLGVQLKGQWNLGKGNVIPHLGIELDYVSAELPNGSWFSRYTLIGAAVLYGVEVMWLPDLSLMADVRIVEYSSLDARDLWDKPYASSQLSLFSGTSLGIRWYII